MTPRKIKYSIAGGAIGIDARIPDDLAAKMVRDFQRDQAMVGWDRALSRLADKVFAVVRGCEWLRAQGAVL